MSRRETRYPCITSAPLSEDPEFSSPLNDIWFIDEYGYISTATNMPPYVRFFPRVDVPPIVAGWEVDGTVEDHTTPLTVGPMFKLPSLSNDEYDVFLTITPAAFELPTVRFTYALTRVYPNKTEIFFMTSYWHHAQKKIMQLQAEAQGYHIIDVVVKMETTFQLHIDSTLSNEEAMDEVYTAIDAGIDFLFDNIDPTINQVLRQGEKIYEEDNTK